MLTLPVKSVSVILLMSEPVPLVTVRPPHVLRAAELAALVLIVRVVVGLAPTPVVPVAAVRLVVVMVAVPITLVSVNSVAAVPLPERTKLAAPKVSSRASIVTALLELMAALTPKVPVASTLLVAEPT